MKRYSEVVLNGHPDKFCDLVADRFIREAYKADPNAYAQIEMSVWSDVIFLTGGVATSCKLGFSAEDIVHAVGNEIGYSGNNHIDVNRYKIHDHICRVIGDPGRWTNFSNDQCIVVGYAGYDALVHYLPPEHFLAWYFREELVASIASGALEGQGPDGKVLVVMHEDAAGWRLDTLLVTLQQQESASFLE
ncbi:MAG: S-adenosylmethionine synthetase N-terminal domain-containing protein, partial [Candidatus Saccharimonadaceae bacterium]